MRAILGVGVLSCLLVIGRAARADEVPAASDEAPATPPATPSAGQGYVEMASPYRAAPTAQEHAYAHQSFAPTPAAASHGHERGSFAARLRGWLTYRAQPVPRECKCQRTCAPVGAPLYSYFALRYPSAGHFGHSFVAGAHPLPSDHP